MNYLLSQLFRTFNWLAPATGLHLVIGVAGILFAAFPVIFSLAAYTFAIAVRAGVPFWPAILLALGLALLAGGFFALLFVRLSADSFLVFTFAALLAYDALLKSWTSVTGGTLGIAGIVRPEWLATDARLALAGGILAAVVLVAEYLILRGPAGRALHGLKENPVLLAASGVSPARTGSVVLLWAAFCLGVSGIFYLWYLQFLSPGFSDWHDLVVGLSIIFLALRPRVWAIVLATFVVTWLPELLRFLPLPTAVLGHLRVLIYLVLLIVLLLRHSARLPTQRAV